MTPMRCAVVGAGSWGTALGSVLASKGWPVTLWDIDTEVLDDVRTNHRNTRYLPGIELPGTLTASAELATAVNGADLVLVVVPSPVVRAVARRMATALDAGAVVCSAVKGIESGTLATMHQVLHQELPPALRSRVTALSGPSFAHDVARGLPAAVTVAGADLDVATRVQQALHAPTFRVYTSTDLIGVEVAGCVKNVVAIAAGMCHGLEFGASAQAALMTRGLAEITRLAVSMGAREVTLSGLAGMGDLVLTCTSELSRNFRVGLGLGQGRELDAVVAELGQVAEGVGNAHTTVALAERQGVEMPISQAVRAVLDGELSARDAAVALMSRAMKPEV